MKIGARYTVVGVMFSLFAMWNASVPAAAGAVTVGMPTRNLSIGFTDFVVPVNKSLSMEIDRYYNSLSDFQGIFGYGWDSNVESSLLALPDGSVEYEAYGGGAERQLVPAGFDKNSGQQKRVLTAAAVSAQMIGSTRELKTFSDAMDQGDEQLRENRTFIDQGFLQPAEISVGETFNGEMFGKVRLIRVPEGYLLEALPSKDTPDPIQDVFDVFGRLLRQSALGTAREFVLYHFSDDGRLGVMHDNFGRAASLFYNTSGKVDHISPKGHATAQFRYSDFGDLTYSRDVDGVSNRYRYDNNHNLVEVDFTDRKPLKMSYAQSDGKLSTLQCPDGTRYRFNDVTDNGTVTAIEVVKTDRAGESTTTRLDTSQGSFIESYCD